MLPWLLGGGALLLFAASGKAATEIDDMTKLPSGTRGLKNKNPGNIRISTQVFNGEVVPSTDKLFKQFVSMAYGYRAIFKILQTYLASGHNTITKIINRWAPPSENQTSAYVDFVSKFTNIPADKIVSYSINPTEIVKIVKAISRVENGVDAIDKDVSDGYQLWLKG